MSPALLQALHDMPSADLRQALATIAGIHAHRDADGGKAIAEALRRIADRLDLKPRVPT